jgi:LysM repeat protein
MRLNLRDAADLSRLYLRRYWAWMSSGSLLRFAIGYGVPIAVFVFAVRAVSGGGGMPADFSALAASPGPSAQVAGAAATAVPAGTAAPQATPTVAKSVLTYIVKSGDNLGAICAAHVPAMSIDACVSAIVQLNKLGGPDQLSVGQSLTLPAATTTTSASNQGTGSAATRSPEDGATGTPRPTSTGVTAAPTPHPSATSASRQPSSGTVTIDFVSTPIKVGQKATVQASAPAKGSCSLQYTPPAGSPSSAAALIARAADASGIVSWDWDIAGNTKKGKGTVIVTCGTTAVSAYIEIS